VLYFLLSHHMRQRFIGAHEAAGLHKPKNFDHA
jgi:hypothetical protein